MAQIEGISSFAFGGATCDHPLGNQSGETTMALQLRPNCEYCDKDLPPNAADARICSYECTFCADCVETKLAQRLPELRRRLRTAANPAAPSNGGPAYASTKQLPSDKRAHLKYSVRGCRRRTAPRLRDIPPQER